MSIASIPAYAHLTPEDVDAIGVELDAVQRDIMGSLGEDDANYIRNVIRVQRATEIAGRAVLFASWFPPAWLAGVGLLSFSKIVENMEIGHNVIHGQWDWMNDPEIHSSVWDWDNAAPAAYWKQTHNFIHHKYTNVLGMDDDVGYGAMRVTRDQKWMPFYLGNPIYNFLIQGFMEYGVAIQHLEIGRVMQGKIPKEEFKRRLNVIGKKVGKQVVKDYIAFPLLTGPAFLTTLTANFTANFIRNYWSSSIIWCGHFPDGAEKFKKQDLSNETRGEWYLRQMLGSANIECGPAMDFMSGNLSHQIEHHLWPDMPSNRLHEASKRVRALCEKYDLPYTTGPFLSQYFKAVRTIWKLALPDNFLKATRDNAPETASENMFLGDTTATIDEQGNRHGLLSKQNERIGWFSTATG